MQGARHAIIERAHGDNESREATSGETWAAPSSSRVTECGGHLATKVATIAELKALKKDYIPEVSEIRMVRRAPDRPIALSEVDARYVADCLGAVEASFGLVGFPGVDFRQIPARALIGKFIDWWRGLEPATEVQREAHARLPGAIRLLDTVSALMDEQARRDRR